MTADGMKDDSAVAGFWEAWADGACLGNPGPGGWGVLLRREGEERELSGGEALTTNNRMELMAVIEALRAVDGALPLVVHTDSRYVQQGISSWIANWKRRGWRTSGGGAVKNRDLWETLDALAANRSVRWNWVPGHAGVEGNERADGLASAAARDVQRSTP